MEKRNINIKYHINIKSQELNPEDNRSSQFQDIDKGKSFGYVV